MNENWVFGQTMFTSWILFTEKMSQWQLNGNADDEEESLCNAYVRELNDVNKHYVNNILLYSNRICNQENY